MITRTITLSAEQWREISEALDCYCDEGCPEGGPGWKSAKLSDACNSFAAALAQPEPEGPTDKEIIGCMYKGASSVSKLEPTWINYNHKEIIAGVRCVLDMLSTLPVPTSQEP